MPHSSMKKAALGVIALNLLRHGSVMHRRTRIVATVGPASRAPETLARLIAAGVSVFRLNFSHGTRTEKMETAATIRAEALRADTHVAIMCDLQGPKIRVGKFEADGVDLENGQTFILDASRTEPGNSEVCGVDYAGLPGDVGAGDTLLLNDGLIRLVVTDVTGPRVTTVVRAGGWLGSHKGINKAHGGLTAPALTDKDIADIETVAEMKADYVAVSFPKNGSDMLLAARLVREAVERHHPVAAAAAAASPNAPSSASSRVHKVRTVAKVERCEAIECLDEIIHASDAVMVARGDLGVEVGQASVPGIQKRMVRLARQLGKPVIVATQMMESMITNPVPTRAEVSDVANAVLDGTDCVMLSAESASGKYPVESVEWLHRICLEAEHSRHDDNESGGGTGIQVNGGGSSSGRSSGHGGHFPASAAQLLHRGPVPVSGVLTTMPHAHASDADNTSQEQQQQQQQQQQQPRLANIDEGLAIGALFAAAHTGCRVLACVTETGETALRMSRCTHDLPVIAVTNRLSTARRTAMFAGVSTLVLDTLTDSEAVFTDVRRELLRLGFVKAGDRIGLTFGNPVGIAGGTNALMIRTV